MVCQVGTSHFRFPALDTSTEAFLWRRKADLEAAIASMPAAATASRSDQAAPGRAEVDLLDAMTLGNVPAGGFRPEKGQRPSTAGELPSSTPASTARSKSVADRRTGGRSRRDINRRSRRRQAGGSVGAAAMAALEESATGARGLQLAMIKESFARLDVDGDGFITPRDLVQAFGRMGRDTSDRG